MPEFQTDDGLVLHYTDEGRGPPLLCLAGLTRNSDDFSYLRPHLTGHRLICLDYRGRGRSAWAADYTSYAIDREARDSIQLLDHLGLDRVSLLGTSRGGLIAMVLTAMAPERLNGVILNDIGPELDKEGLARIIDYVGAEPPFATLDEAAEALKAGYAQSFPGVPLSRWRAQAAFMWYEKPGGGVGLRYDPRLRDALIDQQSATGEPPDLWQLFDGLRALPLAVLRGENSDLLAPGTLQKMASRHPDMIGVTVPDRGHVPFLDEPEALKAIRALLGRVA